MRVAEALTDLFIYVLFFCYRTPGKLLLRRFGASGSAAAQAKAALSAPKPKKKVVPNACGQRKSNNRVIFIDDTDDDAVIEIVEY